MARDGRPVCAPRSAGWRVVGSGCSSQASGRRGDGTVCSPGVGRAPQRLLAAPARAPAIDRRARGGLLRLKSWAAAQRLGWGSGGRRGGQMADPGCDVEDRYPVLRTRDPRTPRRCFTWNAPPWTSGSAPFRSIQRVARPRGSHAGDVRAGAPAIDWRASGGSAARGGAVVTVTQRLGRGSGGRGGGGVADSGCDVEGRYPASPSGDPRTPRRSFTWNAPACTSGSAPFRSVQRVAPPRGSHAGDVAGDG